MTEKLCSSCKITKNIEFFNVRYTRKDGGITYQPYCKECNKKASSKWYKNNPNRIVERNCDNRHKFIESIRDMKSSVGCVRCSEKHPACLEYHHVDPTDKSFSIGEGIYKYGKSTILNEIEKCEVLCSNCHKKLHWDEKQLGNKA